MTTKRKGADGRGMRKRPPMEGRVKAPPRPRTTSKVWSPELAAQIVAEVERTGYMTLACDLLGISVHTAQHWISIGGREPDSEHGQFARDVRKARGRCMSALLEDDRVSPQWRLSKLDRELFGDGPGTAIQVNVQNTMPTREEALKELRALIRDDAEIARLLTSGD